MTTKNKRPLFGAPTGKPAFTPTMARRDFLKITGASLAGLAASPSLFLSGCGNAGTETLGATGKFSQDIRTSGALEWVGESVNSFHFPHFTSSGQKNWADLDIYYAYFVDHNEDSFADSGVAFTTDGDNFIYIGKVIGKGPDEYDFHAASFPAVQKVDGIYYMLYEGESITNVNSVCLAISDNGLEWEKKGPVIVPYGHAEFGDKPSPGVVGDIDVGTPTLYYENGQWHVFFHMFSSGDKKVRIGYATGTDILNLFVSHDILIDTDSMGFETGTVGARSSILKRGDLYYMFYEIANYNTNTVGRFDESQWGIGVARSKNPGWGWQKWDKNALLLNPALGFGYDGPEIFEIDDKLWLYFRVQDLNGASVTIRTEIIGL